MTPADLAFSLASATFAIDLAQAVACGRIPAMAYLRHYSLEELSQALQQRTLEPAPFSLAAWTSETPSGLVEPTPVVRNGEAFSAAAWTDVHSSQFQPAA